MEFSELLLKRRSIRAFEDKEVPMELIDEVIADSLHAPSGGNRQVWGFVIVNDKDTVKRISDSSKKNILDQIEKDPNNYMAQYKDGLSNEKYNVFYNAPCVVFILGEKGPMGKVDPAILATYFMLSASSKGLGTCWIGLGTSPGPEMKAEMGVPDDMSILAPLCLGYPKNIPAVPERKPVNILKRIG